MRVLGTNNNTIEIRLVHKGMDRNYHCVLKPNFYNPNIEQNKEVARIEFNDLMEVEELIEMLSRFKTDCRENIGFWEEGIKKYYI